jgi:hypothetical protein
MSPAAIPRDGLRHVLNAWSGQGQLLDALAAVEADDPVERSWTAVDIRRRAYRILFAQLLPHVSSLPVSTARWLDVLPAQSRVERVLAGSPSGRIDYARTRARGWPPDAFVVRLRDRVAEELLVKSAAWVLGRLLYVADQAALIEPTLPEAVGRQLRAARALMEIQPLVDATPERPDQSALVAIRHSGPPWSTLASMGRSFVDTERHLEALARRLIEPDERLAYRLFHLAVLGEVLLALMSLGGSIVSLRPLSASSSGPSYVVHLRSGEDLQVWFEAASIWRQSGARSPYRSAMSGIAEAGARSLGPDVLLKQGRRGLILECKYSSQGAYVASGYEQVVAYAAELRGAILDDVEAAVVGPVGVVTTPGSGITAVGRIHVVPADFVRQLVRGWLP